MDDTAVSTPSPASASATSASAAAGCAAASDKTINAVVADSSTVNLLIKSSNQQYDDMNIESDLCWTVQRLKKQLSLVYPGKPDIQDQKLIYSGKLLDDNQKLSEVIRIYKDVYQQHHIFHLVCATKNIIKPPVKLAAPPKDVPAVRNATNSNSSSNVNTNINQNELRNRHMGGGPQQISWPIQSNNEAYQWTQAVYTQPTIPITQQQNAINAAIRAAGEINPQYAYTMMYNSWMQQVYAHYMQSFVQSMPTSADNPTPTAPELAAALPPYMTFPAFLQHVPLIPTANNNANNLATAAEPQPAVQPNDAAGAAVEPQPQARAAERNFPNIQEEPEIRDWLDSFFSFTRLAIFVTVLYFNSSPLRCLLVVLIASVIYLYHIGVLRRRRERNNNNINRNNNAGEVAFAAVQIQRMMDGGERENNNQAAAAAEPAVAQDAPADAAAAAANPAAAPAAASANVAGGENAAALAAEAVVVEPADANNSVISVVRTFIITFFTSLLPEAPAL